MTSQEALFKYCLRIADSSLIIGHRLSEWCGHGPILEEDIAMTNMALDYVGQARTLFAYAAEVEGKGRTEDDLAYLRLEREYTNALLCERPNGDFAETCLRQYLFSVYTYHLYTALSKSSNETIAGFATKSVKEVAYHKRHTGGWMLRLGDGTEESHQRAQDALNSLWMWTGDLFDMDDSDQQMIDAGIGTDLNAIKSVWEAEVTELLQKATLSIPETSGWMQTGSKKGMHSEHLGFILAELQYLQRSYPGCNW